MKLMAGILALACVALGIHTASLMVDIVSAHGHSTSADPAEAARAAAFMELFALAGVILPTVGAFLLRRRKLVAGVVTLAAALLALAINATNTGAAVAARSSAKADELATALRNRAADEQTLAEMRARLVGMRFETATDDDVMAAEASADRAHKASERADQAIQSAMDAEQAAVTAAEQECAGGVGTNCRKRREEEAAARDATAAARAAAATAWLSAGDADMAAQAVRSRLRQTQERDKLDGEIKKAAAKLDALDAIADPHAQGKLMAAGLGLGEEWAPTLERVQGLASSGGLEYIALAIFIAAEALGSYAVSGLRLSEIRLPASRPVTAPSSAPARVEATPAPGAKRRAADGDVRRVLASIVEPEPGSRIEAREIGRAVLQALRADGLEPMEAQSIMRAVGAFCQAQRIHVDTSGEAPAVVGVRLAGVS